MPEGDFRVFGIHTASRESRVHLVADNAEASLCGIPRSALGVAATSGDLVCRECVEWLPKRSALSAALRRTPHS
ncbi:MAG TPA: hypothetical protein VFL27_14190 [Candidatus Dormibacteraeota bacterium]|nr:hypothetical protein [Candidatus Dormibacteraeota bacterium]